MAEKPPLSDPMAEARAEDAAEAARKAALAAPQAPAEPEVAPEPVEAAEEAESAPEEAPAEEAPPEKPKRRSTEEVMASRIGAKTKEVAAEKARADKAEAELAAARALLAARGDETPTETAPQGERRYTEAEVDARAAIKAAEKDFTDRANATYSAGKEKFGDWDAKMAMLGNAGLYSDQLLEAAMESGAPLEVMHHLATELGETERLTGLTPVRMGAEIAKLATKLTAPKGARVSSAPAPITPVTGSATPTVDLGKLAEGNDMAAYAAARAKMGDPWATGRRGR